MTTSRKSMVASDHQDKDVRKVLAKILDGGRFELFQGGHWGMLRCTEGCCQIAVSGTPKNPQRHARDLAREASKCPRDDGDVRSKVRRAPRR